MQADLVISTQADFDLYEHLNAACYTMYRKNRSILVTIIAAVLLGGYLGISSLIDQDLFFLFIVTPIWLVIFLTTSYFMLRTSTVAKRAAKRALRNTTGAPMHIQYSFFPDHLGIKTPTVEVNTDYQGITALVETSKFFLVFTGPANAHCIKKMDLGPSNVSIFREYMQDKTGKIFIPIKY